MISVRTYQDDRTACMGKHQHFPKSTIHRIEVVSIHRPLGYGL